jgi:hypothetical protein
MTLFRGDGVDLYAVARCQHSASCPRTATSARPGDPTGPADQRCGWGNPARMVPQQSSCFVFTTMLWIRREQFRPTRQCRRTLCPGLAGVPAHHRQPAHRCCGRAAPGLADEILRPTRGPRRQDRGRAVPTPSRPPTRRAGRRKTPAAPSAPPVTVLAAPDGARAGRASHATRHPGAGTGARPGSGRRKPPPWHPFTPRDRADRSGHRPGPAPTPA